MREVLSEQIWFENTRIAKNGESLWTKNADVDFAVHRINLELAELQEAVRDNHPSQDQVMEAIDVLIFATSILSHMAVAHGYSIEQVQEMTRKKLEINQIKYHEDNFSKSETVDQAIALSRELWKK